MQRPVSEATAPSFVFSILPFRFPLGSYISLRFSCSFVKETERRLFAAKPASSSDVWCSPQDPSQPFPLTNFVKFLHVSLHCHGPACISVEMFNADTNTSICKVWPHYGQSDKALDEAGYAAGILPCIWGTAEEGFRPPPVVGLATNIRIVKVRQRSCF
eukprot:SAG22_NODE_273_length_13182_cov_12.693419_10_plen_159_part_00